MGRLSHVVSIDEAETHLSQLIARAEAGEEVLITRNGTPVVKLVPVGRPRPRRQFGAMRGKARVGPAFFEPLPECALPA